MQYLAGDQVNTMDKLRDTLFSKLAAAAAAGPLSPALISQMEHRLRDLVPSFRTPNHPPYASMISNAVENLNENSGSTEEAISAYIVTEYKDLPLAHKLTLRHYLDKLCEAGEIVFTASGRYMLPGRVRKQRRKGRRNKNRCEQKQRRKGRRDENRCEEICGAGKDEMQVDKGTVEVDVSINNANENWDGERSVMEMDEAELDGVNQELQIEVIEEGSELNQELQFEVMEERSEHNQEVQMEAMEEGSEINQEMQIEAMEEGSEAQQNQVMTKIQLERPELVRQADCQDSGCANELEQLKQEVAQRLSISYHNPILAMEVNQLKEEMANMKKDMQELTSEKQKVFVDVELHLLKKTYSNLLEKTKKVRDRLLEMHIHENDASNSVMKKEKKKCLEEEEDQHQQQAEAKSPDTQRGTLGIIGEQNEPQFEANEVVEGLNHSVEEINGWTEMGASISIRHSSPK